VTFASLLVIISSPTSETASILEDGNDGRRPTLAPWRLFFGLIFEAPKNTILNAKNEGDVLKEFLDRLY